MEISGVNNFTGTIIRNFEIEKEPGEQEENPGEDKPSEDDPGEENPGIEENPGGEEKDPEKELEYQIPEEQKPENDTPQPEAMKDSLANLKLPFSGNKDYGYISTPYFWINVLAILVVFAIYRLICINEKSNKK